LTAGAKFAEAFGEADRALSYRRAADEIRGATDTHLWLAEEGCFARMVNWEPDRTRVVDRTIDSALAGLWLFGMYAPDDPKIVGTMRAIRERLWVKSEVCGVARYANDYYHQVSTDVAQVPGNPWFISTLWLAQWYAETARSPEDLTRALELLQWTCDHALPSGVLAEQVHPYSGAALSVSPLTWSHAAFVTAVHAYLRPNLSRLRSHGPLGRRVRASRSVR
jgi:GH15 family glucan-1,4-alpha-glucosidase